MRHFLLTCDAAPELPSRAFQRAFGRNAPATLEGGKGGGAPAAPNPWTTAAATTQTNQDTAAYNKALNLGNYSNPFGGQNSHIVAYDPQTSAPIYQTDVTANPQLQGAMDGLFGQIGNSAGINQNAQAGLSGLEGQYGQLNAGLSGLRDQYDSMNSGLNNLFWRQDALHNSLSPDAAQNAQKQGQNAAYSAQTQYLDPQFSQQKESLDAQLANQGITPGSQAYNNAMTNFNNTKQQAYSNAQNQSILTGSQIGTQNWNNQLAGINAQSGLYGQQAGLYNQMSGNIGAQGGLFGQIGNNMQGQAGLYGQQVGIGQTPYSNLQSIAGMIPGYSGPAASGAQPADIGGYMNNAYQGQLAGYNARQASNNSTMGTVGSLIGAAAIAAF